MKKFRLAKLQLTSDTANRSGLQTVNMTSSTPNTVTGTTFKNVLVDETGEFVVSSAPVGAITEVYRGNTAPATPSTGWLWVDTSGSGEVLKQWNGTARSELDHLSVLQISASTTISENGTLVMIDGNSGAPIDITLPLASSNKGRRIEFYKWRGTSPVSILSASANIHNVYAANTANYAFKNSNPLYFCSVRSDGTYRVLDDDNIYNRVANTLFVDLNFGNNTFGVREFESRPFLTVAAAVAASQPGDTIVLRKGEYAIGNLVLPHSLNFTLEDGANWASGALGVPASATVKVNGGTCYRTGSNSNLFVIRGDNVSILGNIPYGSADGVSMYDLTFTTAYTGLSLYFSVGRMDEVVGAGTQYYLSRNATSTVLTNCDIAYKGESMAGNLRGRFGLVDSNVQIDCDDYDGLTVGVNNGLLFNSIQSTGRSRIVYNGKTYNTNNSTQPVFSVAGESYGYDMHINILDFKGTAALVSATSSINANIFCTGNYRASTSTSLSSAVINLQQSLTNPSASTIPLKLYLSTTLVENLNNTSKATIAGYSVGNSVVGLIFGVNAVITSKVLRSLKNEVIGIDHSNPQTIDDQVPGLVEIYGTKLEKLGRDGGAGYDGVIFVDTGGAVDTIQDNIIRLYNGVSFVNLGDTFAIAGFPASATNSIPTIEYYDDIYTNGLTNNTTYFEKYMHKPTNTIAASGSYTVLAYENDLYYDLTLGSLTLVLPDPTKFINREISIKATAIHPTNSITIDPMGAFLIDGNPTFSFSAITNLPNYTFKSYNGQWRVK